MAPNSEKSTRIGQLPFLDDTLNREKQRPPIYNPEDYALSLKKWGRKPSNGGGIALYSNPQSYNDPDCHSHHHHRPRSSSFRDYRNPMLQAAGSEMTLRQFSTVSELLGKLKSDLRLAYPSFIQEFIADPLDGITLLLDLLRAIQLSQSNGGPGSSGTGGKMPPSLQRRALLDELACLQCLLVCCVRYTESTRKLSASSAGLFTLAICIMSNVNKSRILALQLLTKACQSSTDGHVAVSEAMSTLRLRFGEPVRFRFLIGMLMSAGGQGDLLAAGMKFVNTFLDTTGTAQKRLYVQAELEQAGFDIVAIKQNIGISSSSAELIFEELDHWEKKHLDVETLTLRLENVETENDSLRDKVLLLERRIQILLEEKGILISLEQCLKERCSELQGEVHSLKSSGKSTNSSQSCRSSKKKSESNKQEDEGISSSERSLTPENLQQEPSVYELYSVQSETVQMPSSRPHKITSKKLDEDDEETTIDEVIEELKNIINDAETEAYIKEEKVKENERRRLRETRQITAKKTQLQRDHLDGYVFDNEAEIIPSILHPQPPRKARSLVHLFIPAEDYDCSNNKELFFENETMYTSDEGSDSLLSASKCQLPRIDKEQSQIDQPHHYDRLNKHRNSTRSSIKRSESFRHLTKTHNIIAKQTSFDESYYYNTPVMLCHQQQKTIEDFNKERARSKSLDRIDDGLGAMVDIVVTDEVTNQVKVANNATQFRTKSDSGNLTGTMTTLSRSISHMLFSNQKRDIKAKVLSQHSGEETDKIHYNNMFLPVQRDLGDVPYYFPRVQEKRFSTSSSFLIKRGHTNAGLYSGQTTIRDTNNNNNNNQCNTIKKHEYSSNSSRISGKVTDSPSGLY